MNKQEHINSLGIPEGYFKDLKTDILREVEISEAELFLDQHFQKKLGLRIPYAYKNSLKNDIIYKNTTTKTKVFNLWKSVSVVAASVLLFLLGIDVYNELDHNQLAVELTFEELLAETSISEEHLAYLEYDELEELDYATTDIELDDNILEFLLEDELLLNELTEDYLEF